MQLSSVLYTSSEARHAWGNLEQPHLLYGLYVNLFVINQEMSRLKLSEATVFQMFHLDPKYSISLSIAGQISQRLKRL